MVIKLCQYAYKFANGPYKHYFVQLSLNLLQSLILLSCVIIGFINFKPEQKYHLLWRNAYA